MTPHQLASSFSTKTCCTIAFACLLGAGSLRALSIVIVPGPGLSSNSAALASFNRAASEWQAQLGDPITVTINADLGNSFPSPSIIGSTSSVILLGSYDEVRTQLLADSASKPGKAIVFSLPTAAQFSASLKAGDTLSGSVQSTKADFKAMGFSDLDADFGTSDATITFNQSFNFYYGGGSGIGAGQIDFQTVAAHEIGHALGFYSAVDDSDNSTAPISISPSALDLFRFGRTASPTDPTTGAPTNASQFTSYKRDLRPGNEDVTSDTVNNFGMSTGVTLGDGRQASHWKDDAYTGQTIGIMDPTLASGTITLVGAADLRAMTLIGYDMIPEPGGAAVCMIGSLGLLVFRVRSRRKTA